MQQHQFFQQFGIHPQMDAMPNPTYMHNCMILEIYNNWPFCRWLMDCHRNQCLRNITQVDGDWINFIINNNINLEEFGKDNDSFLTKYWVNAA